MAKALRQQSVLGSYLDPLADKAVVGAAIGALGWTGSIPPELGVCVLGRDALLVSAHFYHRYVEPSCTSAAIWCDLLQRLQSISMDTGTQLKCASCVALHLQGFSAGMEIQVCA